MIIKTICLLLFIIIVWQIVATEYNSSIKPSIGLQYCNDIFTKCFECLGRFFGMISGLIATMWYNIRHFINIYLLDICEKVYTAILEVTKPCLEILISPFYMLKGLWYEIRTIAIYYASKYKPETYNSWFGFYMGLILMFTVIIIPGILIIIYKLSNRYLNKESRIVQFINNLYHNTKLKTQ